MQKPGFSVVSLVCCLLAVFGLAVTRLRERLPPQPANSLASESEEYLKQGAFQQINWHRLDSSSLALARRLDRPIMLVLGTVWSKEARQADEQAFTDPDVQSFLSRNFVCIRVDLDSHPQWVGAFLPLSRVVAGVGVAFQIVYLDPEGKLYDFYGRRGRAGTYDPVAFLDEVVGAHSAYEQLASGKSELAAGTLQKADLDVLSQAPATLPDIDAYLEDLRKRINPIHGGFPAFGQIPRPLAIQTLLLAGDLESAQKALDPMLRSGWVDWLDGGFFRRSRRVDWTDVEFDKVALAVAENMRVVALYAKLAKDSFAERIAKNAFDALIGEFAQSGLIATARIGDENASGRSARTSFSAKELRTVWGTGLLAPNEALAARRLFGLTVEDNPQMNLIVRDPKEFSDPAFEPVLAKLRAHKASVKSRFTGHYYANVNAGVVAHLYACARLWGDGGRTESATERFRAAESFSEGGYVTRQPTQEAGEEPYLGDYLTLSEAYLQRFLATGDTRALAQGDRILDRARTLFGGLAGWSSTVPDRLRLLPDTAVPELLDTVYESLTAKVIRLNNTYGRLLRGGDNPAAADHVEQAAELVGRYGSFMGELGVSAAGYFAASIAVLDDGHAFAVGPQALPLASALYRLVPTRLVAPALGPVRSDLQKRAPGCYVVSGATVRGPFSVEDAAMLLGASHSKSVPVAPGSGVQP